MNEMTIFTINQSTLEEMHLAITERIFPFITFNVVDENGNLIASSTIPWARFREMEDRPDLWEVRSNDDPVAPRQTLFLSNKILSKYIFTGQPNNTHYVFTYTTGRN